MLELTSSPTRLLRVSAGLAKLALGLLAAAWITLGLVWGALHFLIVPRIEELRPWMEQQATSTLGIPVRIGAVTATSNGLIPSIEIKDISLFDPQGREALRLPLVLAALSPRSALGLGFEQLYIDRPVLDVRRTADGRFWVAGLPLPSAQAPAGPGADWLFSQTEVVVRHGTLRWSDELRDVPPLEMSDVDVVLRNGHHSHALRVDANPPAHWGERLRVMGVFKHPLLARSEGDWRAWVGQLYAEFSHVDVAHLRRYVDLGVDVAEGRGAVRAWVDVDRTELRSAMADVALRSVNVRMGAGLDALALDQVSGRVGTRMVSGGREFFTESLAFDTQDGLHWPGGNLRIGLFDAKVGAEARGEIVADRLDLAAMGSIARRLPLGAQFHSLLEDYAPQGVVESLQASWQGSPERALVYSAKGQVSGLNIPAATRNGVRSPGLQGLDADFDFSQLGGKVGVAMRNGAIDAAAWFDEPRVSFDQLSGDVSWSNKDGALKISATNVRFGNADAQGDMQLNWHSGEGPLGVLDVQGSLSRAAANQVHRYLPHAMDKEVRSYVKDALVSGTATGVKFKVKGPLKDFPFSDARQGDFRVSANVENLVYAYVPLSLQPKDSLPWPALTLTGGEFLIDRALLQIKATRASLAGVPGIQIQKAEGTIKDLYDQSTVLVVAETRGPLAELLTVVNGSPLSAMTNKVLAHASGSGNADTKFRLGFPIGAIDRATVQGTVLLANNDIQITPETPRMLRTKGVVAFSENGFSVIGGQARALGGEVRIEGGLSTASQPPAVNARPLPSLLRITGTATSEGLRQAKELGLAARLAQYANGTASYAAVLGLRGGVPELQINSTLGGMALNLPAPLAKTADSLLPIRLETSVVRTATGPGTSLATQDQLQLDIGRMASITYVRDITGVEPKVLRGSIAVGLTGDESAPMPAEGVVANIQMAHADLDAWSDVLAQLGSANAIVPSVGTSYLPNSLAVRAQALSLGGRKLNNVVVGGGRDGLLWRANLDATELNGYVEYRQPSGPSAGRLYARLARLAIGQSTAQDVESILDEQPASIPALDIVVEDFELRGKKLGRVEVDAVNLAAGSVRDAAREWRLNRFNIITPEAVLTAEGNWTNIAGQAPVAKGNIKERRRTAMNFKLEISDSGELLKRFGMNDVVRKGRGRIEGKVAWLGSPITLDYPSLAGNFNVNVETGQFLKADPGIAKLLGVLSLQSLPRRLAFDFRDVFSEGFAFDYLRGDVTIIQGIARTGNLQMKGVNATVMMEGQADIARETQSIKVVVVPEINAGSASVIASIVNPIMGLSTFLAQLVLRLPLIEAATQEFFIDGTWADPRVTKVDRK